MSENGVWEPVTVTRKLEGEYRCTKGTESHAVYINVFPSEDVIFDRFIPRHWGRMVKVAGIRPIMADHSIDFSGPDHRSLSEKRFSLFQK